ncbi:MAG: SsrA-binding protein SmpB [Planctomycetota bacterium]
MKVVARNKQAFRDYEILEKYEAGIVLQGTEVKSIRQGKVQLAEAYVRVEEGEAFLVKSHIAEYTHGSWTNHRPDRRRKLLLHRREIERVRGKTEERGLTLVPLALYLNDKGLVKLEIGLGRGKKLHDKRQDIKKRAADLDIRRALRRGRD